LPAHAKECQAAAKKPSQRFHSISADVTIPEENKRVLDEVTVWNNGQPPDIVWANAGSSHPTLFIDTAIETLRNQMDTNYWSATYLAHATLRLWLKPVKQDDTGSTSNRPRHFIMTSSTACFVGVAGYAPYSPPKAAMRSLADTLRSELNLYNGHRRFSSTTGRGKPATDIQIHCVVPGGIKSPGFEAENKVKHPVTHLLEEGDPTQTEDEAAAAAVKGLERGGYLITTQWFGYAMRASAMGGSPRTNVVLDTLAAWVTSLAWLWIAPDMEGTVWKFGKGNEVNLP
jgi:3-dehydrosphinganine reductase